MHEMRTRGPGREGRPPSGASAPASSDSSGSAAMRPGAAAPDDPEEVAPLPEPVAPSRRASRAWDRPASALPPPPGARPPAVRNAAAGVDDELLRDYDQERHPFEDTDDEDPGAVNADEGFDYDPPAAAAPSSVLLTNVVAHNSNSD